MLEYQITVVFQNGQEIVSKWISDEKSVSCIYDLVSNTNNVTNLQIPSEDGSHVIVMETVLKNSVIKLKERKKALKS